MTHAIPFIALAFLLTLLLIPPVRALAARLGLLDRPGGRKLHEDVVPPAGGLVVFPVYMAMTAFLVQYWGHYAWFYAALVLIIITGMLDDRFSLQPRVKFAAQLTAALLIVIPGMDRVVAMGDIFGGGIVFLGWMSIPFSIIAAVLLINAINLMDGLDGLAGGLGVIVLGAMAWCVHATPAAHFGAEMLVACAALAGFLAYNMRAPWRKKASIFLGDAGSLALGLTIAWYAMGLAGRPNPMIHPTSLAWILALPIMDTCGQFARRIREGRHPFSADQDHFHHHFIRIGMTPGKATLAVLSVALAYAVIGVGGIKLGVPSPVLMYLWAGLLLGHIYLSMHPERFRQLIAGILRIRYAPA